MTRRVRSHWQGALIVCGKCSKKLGGGFGPKRRTPLAKALRQFLGLKKGRKAALGMVETRCLGICPRAGVVVIPPRPGSDWLVVSPGSELGDVAAALGIAVAS